MAATLRALVLGSGFAGKGHTEALRYCGVEVVGMVSRTPEVVEAVGAELGIPYTGTDWQAALDALQPDIVAIGTPGGVHVEPILQAIAQGCHVYCDKPLAPTADESRQLYAAARAANVKTAYAASFRYCPSVLYAHTLIQDGIIGNPQEIECVSHYNLNPLIPFGWSHRLDMGGGRLNNNFTHKLSIVLQMLDGVILSVCGETRNDMPQAPVVSGVHDFRERENFAPNADELDSVQWKDADSDWSYTVLTRIQSPYAGDNANGQVSVLFKHGGLRPRGLKDAIVIYGSDGALMIDGAYGQGALYRYEPDNEWGDSWVEMPVPESITDQLPDIENHSQRNWTELMKRFVGDIRGEEIIPYQTFRDGWIFQQAIDAVRARAGWVEIEQDI